MAAWEKGAALAESSAGAMALARGPCSEYRHPGDERRRFKPALGPVPGVAVILHFDTFGHRWVEGAHESAPEPDAVLIGIDERTAALARDGRWEVLGPGSVTVFEQGHLRRFPSGSTIKGCPHRSLPPEADRQDFEGHGSSTNGGIGSCAKSNLDSRSPRIGTSSRTVGRGSGRPSVVGSMRSPSRKRSSISFR